MYRHNGQAEVFDHVSDISRDSFCDRESSLEQESFVHHSNLLATAIGNSKVYRSNLQDCAVESSVVCGVNAVVSKIIRSYVTDAIIEKCSLEDVLIRGHEGELASLELVNLSGGLVVDGAVTLKYFHLSGNFYIPRGNWERAPRTTVIQGENGVFVGVTESVEGWLCIGQRLHQLKQWFKCGPRLGRIAGWTPEQIQQVWRFGEELRDVRITAA